MTFCLEELMTKALSQPEENTLNFKVSNPC